MTRRLAAMTTLLVAGSLGCRTPYFVSDGPLKQPLTGFDRIHIDTLANKLSGKETAASEGPVSSESFLKTFPQDLRNRLRQKKVLHLATGPMVTLEGALVRYECEDRPTSYARDTLDNKGIIEIDVVLKDERGARIGSGKAAVFYLSASPEGAMKGAEKRVVTAIRDYLRKHARASSEPYDPDPDDEP